MKIKYLGHASFLVTASDGTRIQFDPYQPGNVGGSVGYGPFVDVADIAVVSHEHGDHNYVQGIPGNPRAIRGIDSETVHGIPFTRIPLFHDSKKGSERGKDIVTVCEVDAIHFCHLGDLGHVIPAEDLQKLGPVDVLCIPVGGFYTIDAGDATQVMQAISPRICIPMHYKTSKLNFPIAPVDEFLKGKRHIKLVSGSETEITSDSLPEAIEVWVFESAL